MPKRVAVIDDSEVILTVTCGALEALGCEVLGMTEPSRALLASGPLDLVLLDVKMPQAFGDDVVAFLRQQWGISAPILLYSSLPEAELAHRAADAHVDGYICKDWGLERLVSAVERVLGTTAASRRDEG